MIALAFQFNTGVYVVSCPNTSPSTLSCYLNVLKRFCERERQGGWGKEVGGGGVRKVPPLWLWGREDKLATRTEERRGDGDITLVLGELGRKEWLFPCTRIFFPTPGLFCGVVRRDEERRGERLLLPVHGIPRGVQSTEGLSMAPLRGLYMGEL